MAYNKTTWQNGDVITAQKLNNIENGIFNNDSSDLFVINLTIEQEEGENTQNLTSDITPSQLKTILENNKNIIIKSSRILQDTSNETLLDLYYFHPNNIQLAYSTTDNEILGGTIFFYLNGVYTHIESFDSDNVFTGIFSGDK